jgi:anti-anti-sigma factor
VTDERVVRLTFSGDLDVYRRQEFAAALPPVESIDRLVIDIRAATLIDSSIIAQLMRFRRQFVEAGREATEIVVVVPEQLRRIFEITGLLNMLTVVTAATEAETAPEAEAPEVSEA